MDKLLWETDMVHESWERLSSRTGVLDVASTPGERKILALILEDRRMQQWGIFGQYQRVYRKEIDQLHKLHYHHCMKLSAQIGDEQIE